MIACPAAPASALLTWDVTPNRFGNSSPRQNLTVPPAWTSSRSNQLSWLPCPGSRPNWRPSRPIARPAWTSSRSRPPSWLGSPASRPTWRRYNSDRCGGTGPCRAPGRHSQAGYRAGSDPRTRSRHGGRRGRSGGAPGCHSAASQRDRAVEGRPGRGAHSGGCTLSAHLTPDGCMTRVPRFSIVTPSYNQASFIGETIASVLTQEGDFEIEYLVMDGGSTDGAVEVIRGFAERVAARTIGRSVAAASRWSGSVSVIEGQAEAINAGPAARHRGLRQLYQLRRPPYFPGAFQEVADAFSRATRSPTSCTATATSSAKLATCQWEWLSRPYDHRRDDLGPFSLERFHDEHLCSRPRSGVVECTTQSDISTTRFISRWMRSTGSERVTRDCD